jgi:phage terminase small subunit
MHQTTASLRQVSSAAFWARDWAHGVSTRRIRREVRKLERRDDLTDLDLARLVAYRNEQRDRT